MTVSVATYAVDVQAHAGASAVGLSAADDAIGCRAIANEKIRQRESN
ncbi:MAG TPA: hypothetical protein VNZ94_11425 [Xanthobacteraceae bacterium]|nr:hypothetical protein [Xanthobacteraceae bacterium]